MNTLINEVYEIIKDYRSDEGKFMTPQRIELWVNQFEESDRRFLLEELKLILGKRYISKGRAKNLVKGMIEFLATNSGYRSPKDFLLDSVFIDHQPEGKSQKVLLQFVDEIIQLEYKLSVSDCNSETPKFYIYFDDVLCTGDTLFKGLAKNEQSSKGWFFKERPDKKTNFEYFKETNARLVLAYFAVHTYNLRKVKSRLWFALNKQNIDIICASNKNFIIDNDFEQPNSKLEVLLPLESIKDEDITMCEEHISQKIANSLEGRGNRPPSRFYRPVGVPTTEHFFSSAENRVRFETIILKKCVEIYNKGNNSNVRMKPLGYGLYSDVNFGFGTLIFTWRNVPFNVPMIFWYPHNNFTSLFERKFVTYDNSTSSINLDDLTV